MYQAPANEFATKFPVISFRKKRLTVAIHAHFNMESVEEVASVRKMIEEAVSKLTKEGQAKVTYSVSNL